MPRTTRKPKLRRTLRYDDATWNEILAESAHDAKANGGTASAARYLERLHRKNVAQRKERNGKERS